jgi:two-component system cell cycle sensor histidine kinase/response regulator CckA
MKPREHVPLSVSDTGHGMDAETKARIFEPFYTTKEVGKGTGLGLATVYGIVKQSDGFNWVESEKGKGATFEVYLPACRLPVSGKEKKTDQSVPGGSENILLVEDETGVRELASEFLKSGGYTVLEARDGAQALECADKHDGAIHVLLSDVVMPRLSSGDLAERLRTKRPDLRVVFMTGYAEFSGNGGSMPSQGHILPKPFSRVTLLEKIREVLGTVPGGQRIGV